MSEWPRLDYTADKPTIESLHLLLQLVGKLPLRLLPWTNHSWQVTLRMTPRGAITRSLPGGARQFSAELDFLDGTIRVACDSGSQSVLEVAGKPIAEVHSELSALLAALGLPAPLYGRPNEIPDAVRFVEDDRPRAWDPECARRVHRAFLLADRELVAFRSLYRGKSSPSHLFWGSFDLAVSRFSGRTAPPHPGGFPGLPDAVAREAYSHEVISAGFWPGNDACPQAAFYAYAYPTPEGLGGSAGLPGAAGWNGELGEFLLPYAAVRTAPEPSALVQEFLDATYAAAAERLAWPSDQVVAATPAFGRPPTAP
ncbi:MAG: DUF5996 family protein [Croceibacterium sp.]